MEKKFVVIACIVIVIALIFMVTLLLPSSELHCGYTEIEGLLELRTYPKIFQTVPPILVYVLVPMYDQYETYLTEEGIPMISLEGYGENDLVRIEGVLYSRDAADGSDTYQMIEIFHVSPGD